MQGNRFFQGRSPSILGRHKTSGTDETNGTSKNIQSVFAVIMIWSLLCKLTKNTQKTSNSCVLLRQYQNTDGMVPLQWFVTQLSWRYSDVSKELNRVAYL